MEKSEAIELDYSINGTSHVIIERKLAYDKIKNTWSWSSPKNIKYRKHQCLDVLKKLAAGTDLQNDNMASLLRPTVKPDLKKEEKSETKKCVKSPASSSLTLDKFWEPPKVEVGNSYLVPDSRGRWVKATLIAIDGSTLTLVHLTRWIQTEYQFLAHPEPCRLLPVGVRILGLHSKIANTGEISRGRRKHQLGVIAEYPYTDNGFRFLIIFDDGSWLYVARDSVWPLYFQSQTIWKMLPESSKEVVKGYLNGLFKPILKYKKGDVVQYRVNDTDREYVTVLGTDASLVLVWRDSISASVRLHRGSPNLRLVPL